MINNEITIEEKINQTKQMTENWDIECLTNFVYGAIIQAFQARWITDREFVIAMVLIKEKIKSSDDTETKKRERIFNLLQMQLIKRNADFKEQIVDGIWKNIMNLKNIQCEHKKTRPIN